MEHCYVLVSLTLNSKKFVCCHDLMQYHTSKRFQLAFSGMLKY